MSDSLQELVHELEQMGAGASIRIEIFEVDDGTAYAPPMKKMGARAIVHSPIHDQDWRMETTAAHVLFLSLLGHVRTLRVRDSMITAGWTAPTTELAS